MRASSVRLFTRRESSRSANSVNEVNFPFSRSSKIACAAASPTPFTAASPKRIPPGTPANAFRDSLMSGGRTEIPISTQSPMTFTMPSVLPISADNVAARKSTGKCAFKYAVL